MNTKTLCQLAVGAAVAVSSLAAQAVVFGPGLNDIELINRENNYRSDASCAANGGCLGAGSGPAGFQLVDPSIANNLFVGDIFAGVFASRTVINQGTLLVPGLGTVWNEDNVGIGGSPIDTFTGYFAQEVKQIQPNVSGSLDRILLGTLSVADPFGILAAGETARAYVDNAGLANTPYVLDGVTTTVAQSIASVTDGALWAAMSVGVTVLGTAVDNDGYLSSLLDVGTPGSELTNGTFFTAWNVTLEGPAYNAGVLAKINDPQEFVKGGSQVGDPVTTGLQNLAGVCPEALGAYACNSIVGNGQLNINENIGPWVFASQDPLQLHSIPEPGSLALLGIALLGFVAAGRRRVA